MNIKELSSTIRAQITDDVSAFRARGIFPKVSVILVGEDEASLSYAQTKQKIAEGLGITVEIIALPVTTFQRELEQVIARKSHDEKIHGILLESPLPVGLDYAAALDQVDPLKDIDGLHVSNLGKLQSGEFESAILPATPLACLRLIQESVGELTGKVIAMVGSGRTVGKPLTTLLIHHGATVISCNQYTKNTQKICLGADIIVSAVGKPGLITADMVHDQSIVIDVGTTFDAAGKVHGDVDFNAVSQIAKLVTPVPGGVGIMTTSYVFQNLIRAMWLQKKRSHFDLSMNEFFTQAAGPMLPGGGGIAPVVGILGATMASMVISLTKNLQNPSAFDSIPSYIEVFKKTYQDDIDGFNSYLDALKLPKSNESEVAIRANLIQKSLIQSCEVPLHFWEKACELLLLIIECARVGNKQVISDAAVAFYLIDAAVKSSFEAIDINTRSIRDEKQVTDIQSKKVQILDQIREQVDIGLWIIAERYQTGV